MARQNRMTPFGTLIATPARGHFMGNRGILHNHKQEIVRDWQHKRWITCLLEFKGRRREIMAPGRYTELFFLDEATALSAGHRPCAECRPSRYREFLKRWAAGSPEAVASQKLTAPLLDEHLHRERTGNRAKPVAQTAILDCLPEGVFIQRRDEPNISYLLWTDVLYAWSPQGYTAQVLKPAQEEVRVLTPPSVLRAIHAGYIPEVHASAGRGQIGRESGAVVKAGIANSCSGFDWSSTGTW